MTEIFDNTAEFIYVNGEFREYREFQREGADSLNFEMPFSGPIIYEVVRFIDRKGVFLKDHYDRFAGSLKLAGIENHFSYETYKEACRQLLKINKIRSNNLKLMYAMEEGEEQPLCLIYASKSFYPDEKYYENGVATAILGIERSTPNAKINRSDYVEKIKSYREKKGVFEVLLKNSQGQLTEGSRSNLFFIKGNTVFTAPADTVLEGVMRKYVFKVCDALGICIDDSCPVGIDSLSEMDSAFLTGTSINVLPISHIEENIQYDTQNQVLLCIRRGFEERIVEEWQSN